MRLPSACVTLKTHRGAAWPDPPRACFSVLLFVAADHQSSSWVHGKRHGPLVICELFVRARYIRQLLIWHNQIIPMTASSRSEGLLDSSSAPSCLHVPIGFILFYLLLQCLNIFIPLLYCSLILSSPTSFSISSVATTTTTHCWLRLSAVEILLGTCRPTNRIVKWIYIFFLNNNNNHVL